MERNRQPSEAHGLRFAPPVRLGPVIRTKFSAELKRQLSNLERGGCILMRHWLILLTSSLFLPACVQIPGPMVLFFPELSSDSSRVHTEMTMMFPGVALDFGSVELRFVEIDGKAPLSLLSPAYAVKLERGSHLLVVHAVKGPVAIFGRAPLLGQCKSSIEFIAEPGINYKVRFSRKNAHIELVNVSTDEVVCEAPCISFH